MGWSTIGVPGKFLAGKPKNLYFSEGGNTFSEKEKIL